MNSELSPLEAQIASGKPTVTLTYGDSMQPLLFHLDTRVVIQKAESKLKRNDLPLYKRPSGKFVMHRIIRVDEDAYYTRGDNRCGLERVPMEWVQGVVTEIFRRGKQFPVTSRGYRAYVALWNALYPIRWIWYHVRVRLPKKRKAPHSKG